MKKCVKRKRKLRQKFKDTHTKVPWIFVLNDDQGLVNRNGSAEVKKMLRKCSTRTAWSMSTDPKGDRRRFKTSQHKKRDRARFEIKRSRFLVAFSFAFCINRLYLVRNSATSACVKRPEPSVTEAEESSLSCSSRSISCLRSAKKTAVIPESRS
jgi:hypothetical protein